jgi:small subunit ribosomal protein S2
MAMQVEQISLMNLFTVGAHRGNKKSALNPRLKKRIYGVNNGLSVINLAETKKTLESATQLLSKLGQRKSQLLVVGTSVHLQDFPRQMAENLSGGQTAYVNHRWLGGTLTNWATIRKTLKTLEKTQSMVKDEEFFENLTRNEQLNLSRRLEKLERFFGGLIGLKNNRPGALVVLDAKENAVAIQEAETMKIPVITLTNTNVETLPGDLKHTIVCNTSSLNTVKLITETLVDAYNQGFAKSLTNVTGEKSEEKKETKETDKVTQ